MYNDSINNVFNFDFNDTLSSGLTSLGLTSLGLKGGQHTRFYDQVPSSQDHYKLQKYDLDNGLRVILQPTNGAPVVAAQVWVAVGSADERPDQAGLAHVHEHMLFKGTARRGVGEIAADVEAAGGHINAFTSFDYTCYYIVQSSRDYENVIDILADVVGYSSFDQEELTRELEVIQEEIKRGLDNPDRVVSQMLFSTAYQSHPYKDPVIGTKESVDSFKRENVVEFFKTYYTPSNMTFVLVGDFEVEEAKKYIEKHFGALSGPKVTRPERPQEQLIRSGVAIKKGKNNQNNIEIGFTIPNRDSDDLAPLKLLSTILGIGDSSILYNELYREKGVVANVYAGTYSPKDPGLFIVSASYLFDDKVSQHQDVLSPLLEIVFDARNRHFTDEEINRACTLLESQEAFRKQTAAGIAMYLGVNEQLTQDVDYERKFLAKLRRISSKELQDVAARYLNRENLTVALYASDDAPEIDAETILTLADKIEKASRQKKSEEQKNLEDIKNLEKKVNRAFEADKIAPRTLRSRLCQPDIVAYSFKNGSKQGVKLIVQEDHHVETASIYAVKRGGVRNETPETSGLYALAAELLTAGTEKHSELEIACALESCAWFMNGVSGRNTFGLQATGLAKYFDRTFEYFRDVWHHANAPQEAFHVRKINQLRQIDARADQLGAFTFDTLAFETLQPHPYAYPEIGTRNSVEQFTQEQVLETFKQLAEPQDLVISVVGCVDHRSVADKVAEAFLRTSSSNKDASVVITSPASNIKLPERTTPKLVVKHKEKEQAFIAVAFNAPTMNDKHFYTETLVRAILAGQGGRLFMELRDKQSLAYSVYPAGIIGIDAAFTSIHIGTSPEKVEQAFHGIYTEIERLRKNGVTPEELKRAKRYLQGNHGISLQSPASRATSFALDELFGFGYQETFRFDDQIEKITEDDVADYLSNYLKKETSVAVVTTPNQSDLASRLKI